MNIVSFVVDGLPRLYYQAELLLFSLSRFARHPREHILVQCTTRVDPAFLAFLDAHGYRYRIIEPFLDGKYCNKIRQLEAFADQDVDGVFLLDADMFVLEPLAPPEEGVFCGKVVDMPNPPLHVLQGIFAAAGIPPPAVVDTDTDRDDHRTLANNFNGGFYYVPGHRIATLRDAWKHWANWLFQRPELFESTQQATHTDQVSMAMALSGTGTPSRAIAANFNYPTHAADDLRTYRADLPVSILHYHWLITEFGLLDGQLVRNENARSAVRRANEAIVGHTVFRHYAGFRRSQIPASLTTGPDPAFVQALGGLHARLGRKLKLVLHAGTPKTGTTSLQVQLAEHAQQLASAGFLYPSNYSRGDGPPKHQWLVSALQRDDVGSLLENLDEIARQLTPDIHTVILSTEGIYNHWWDFSGHAKSLLAALAATLDTSLWLWLRSPQDFMYSFYQQNLKNPQMSLVTCYGRDLSLFEMLQDRWFVKHLDYLGFIQECEVVFGAQGIRLFDYQNDTVTQCANALGVQFPSTSANRENTGLSGPTVQLLRVANRYPLTPVEKGQVVAALKSIDALLAQHATVHPEDAAARRRIGDLSALQAEVLRTDYRLTTT